MQIVSIGDNLHETSNLFSGNLFSGKKKKKNINVSSADSAKRLVTVKEPPDAGDNTEKHPGCGHKGWTHMLIWVFEILTCFKFLFHAALFIFSTLMVQVFISVTSDIGLDYLILDFFNKYKKRNR